MRARTLFRASAALFVATATLGAAPAAHAVPAHATDDGAAVSVIVEAGDTGAARSAVAAAGGNVAFDLPIIGGVSAVVGPSALASLESDPALNVVPDATLHATSGSFSASAVTAQSLDPQLR